jgi:hypothetical protein
MAAAHGHEDPTTHRGARATVGDGRQATSSATEGRVWHAIAKASFAILGYVTPDGQPRTSGVVYTTVGRRLYVATSPDSWKARHIPSSGRVSMTIPVRRGGVLSLLVPIPPATITFSGAAIVHPPGSTRSTEIAERLGALLPDDRRSDAAIIEITPAGIFVTYGIGVPLRRLRDPAASGARVPITAG